MLKKIEATNCEICVDSIESFFKYKSSIFIRELLFALATNAFIIKHLIYNGTRNGIVVDSVFREVENKGKEIDELYSALLS